MIGLDVYNNIIGLGYVLFCAMNLWHFSIQQWNFIISSRYDPDVRAVGGGGWRGAFKMGEVGQDRKGGKKSDFCQTSLMNDPKDLD